MRPAGHFFSLFNNKFNKSNNTGVRMLDSINYIFITLKLLKNHIVCENVKILLFLCNVIMDVITRGVQYVMKTAQYISKFYIYTLHNYFS